MNTSKPATWFRMYNEFATDPKVQMLSEAVQRRFVMLLCLRCSNGDVTLQDDAVAFQLRISNDEWIDTKKILIEKGLLDSTGMPSKWDKRQYASDSSSQRVKKHRDKKKQECNVTVTPPETETETELHSNSSSKSFSTPYDELIEIYEKNLPDLPKVRKSLFVKNAGGKAMKKRFDWVMSECYEHGDRKGQRMAETPEDAIGWFDRFFGYVSQSPFLTGKKNDFKADLHWLMKLENFEKVIQGRYHKDD